MDWLGENICKGCNEGGLNFQNINRSYHSITITTTKKKKKQITESKNGQTIQTDISPKNTDSQEAHEETLNITDY